MVLKQKRDNTDVLIVDASKGFAKVGKNNVLRACDIKRIVDVVTSRSTVGLCESHLRTCRCFRRGFARKRTCGWKIRRMLLSHAYAAGSDCTGTSPGAP